MPGLFSRCEKEHGNKSGDAYSSDDCRRPFWGNTVVAFAALLFLCVVSLEVKHDINLTVRLCWIFGIVIGGLVLWKIVGFITSKLMDEFIKMYEEAGNGYLTPPTTIVREKKQNGE